MSLVVSFSFLLFWIARIDRYPTFSFIILALVGLDIYTRCYGYYVLLVLLEI